MAEEFDVLCLGAGPAGEGLVSELDGSGLTVAIVEGNKVGGECPYWGCIPSKTMLRSAETLIEAERAREFAVSEMHYTVDYDKIHARVEYACRDMDDTKSAQGIEHHGGHLFRGQGRLTGPRTIEVAGTELVARKAVVIATGTSPAIPDIPGLDTIEAWTNREVIHTPTLPKSMLVLGAGPAGVELSQAFSRYGTEVTLLESAPRVLAPEEPEAGDYLQQSLVKEGLNIICACGVNRVEPGGEGVLVHRDSGETVSAERFVITTGRHANSDELDAEAAGIRISDRGTVEVDPPTLVAGDGIYAAGDITGIGGFTHLSDYHGHIIGRRIKGEDARANHVAIPRVTYCDPEVASVGLSEAQARNRGITVKLGQEDLANSTRNWIHGEPYGLVKLVADADANVLVGATLVGPRSGEMISEMSLAIRARVSLRDMADMMHPFPAFSRVFQQVFAQMVSGDTA